MGTSEFMIYDLRLAIYALQNRMNERIGPGSEFHIPAATKQHKGRITNTRGIVRTAVNRQS